MSTLNIDHHALLRLMQISSAALPVGAYAFSQGLEPAIELGYIHDKDSCYDWLRLQLLESLAKTDVPILIQQMDALQSDEHAAFLRTNDMLLAMRETKELRLSDTATGLAFIKLLRDLEVDVSPFIELQPDTISFVSAFAIASWRWSIDIDSACYGWLWSWLENQVAAATKLIPLGQVSAQKLLSALILDADKVILIAKHVPDDAIGASLPGLALVSSWHEQQYSRLFRS